jgi:hypothetical protein
MTTDWLPHQVRKRPGWANARDAERLYGELEGFRAVRRASARDEEERPTFTEQDAISALLAFDKLRPPPNIGDKRAQDGDAEDDEDEDEGQLMVASPGGGREPPKRELEVEKEEERICEVIQGHDDGGAKGPMTVEAALAEACVELGYDEDNPKRTRLLEMLEGCESVPRMPFEWPSDCH